MSNSKESEVGGQPAHVASRVLECLNVAFKDDPDAMQSLLCNRVPCNAKLADHPTVQVGTYHGREGSFHVGLLGVLNGVLASAGLPLVAAQFETDVPFGEPSELVGFQFYEPKGQ